MSLDQPTLAVVWFLLLGVLLAAYAVLDGFDLGVGILHLVVARDDGERRALLQSIGPLWDGNEVWLVTFGGALFAAFPAAYAAVFSGFYTALMLLLLALILRAVSIEFRSKRSGRAWRRAWDAGFALSSAAAALLFGVAVGNAMWGVPVDAAGSYPGALLDQLHPYALGVGVLTTALFALHGALFLGLKTEGALRRRVERAAWTCFGLFLVAYLLVTIATLVALPAAVASFERMPALWAVPVVGILALANIPRCLYLGRPLQGFASSAATVAAMVALLGAAVYPDLLRSSVPGNSLTLWNAASSRRTLTIMLGVAALGMPLVLTYTAAVYWTFRGRVRVGGEGY